MYTVQDLMKNNIVVAVRSYKQAKLLNDLIPFSQWELCTPEKVYKCNYPVGISFDKNSISILEINQYYKTGYSRLNWYKATGSKIVEVEELLPTKIKLTIKLPKYERT